MTRPTVEWYAVPLLALAIVVGTVGAARACDLCAIYTATVMQKTRTGPWIGVAEQFTSFNTVRDGDSTLSNDAGEWLQSSITQIIGGYNIHPRFGVQINVPIISRRFRRIDGGEITRDNETGLGDISVLARYNALEVVRERGMFRLDLLGGVKLPTGESDRLGEELAEGHHDDAHDPAEDTHHLASVPSHHDAGEGEQSGVHGHDLTLGSGSLDGVVGMALHAGWRRAFFDVTLQYMLRSRGDFDYQFANDLTWQGGPGAFAVLGHAYTVAVQAHLSGESKGKDNVDGDPLDDTALTALYLGPRMIATYQDRLHADLGAEWPLVQNVTSVQIVADWRLRLGLVWRF